MDRWPRISIVTPSFNQAPHVVGAVESVMGQVYPDVEHIVVDGGSTDGTLEHLARYPHLKLVSEGNGEHADAVNRGFRLATGDIWGILGCRDLLLSGALHRVAREVDPERARHVVVGRCRFVDEGERFIGVEPPSRLETHRRVLEVWRGQSIPLPAVFWTPKVWASCGGLDDTVGLAWIDYDLCCRFSRAYRFHAVDQVLAARRLLESEPWVGGHRLEDGIALSRRYWGSAPTLTHCGLALSLALFRFDRRGRARRFLRQMKESRRHGRTLQAMQHALVAVILAPEVAFYVSLYPRVRNQAISWAKRARTGMARWGRVPHETAAYLDRAEPWDDGWVGPRVQVTRESDLAEPALAVALKGWADPQCMRGRLVLTIRVDKRIVGRHRVTSAGDFAARVRLTHPLAPGPHTVEVEASEWFVPHRVAWNRDFRPLAWRMGEIALEPDPPSG
jgi:glycosyltransferase involved in cell wall biosynthesis